LYFRRAQFALLVFSVTDQKSFDDIESWKSQITDIEPECEVGLIGCKIDLVEERVVSSSLAEEKSHKLGCVFYHETSALTGEGVGDLFLGFMDSPALQPQLQRERVMPEEENRTVDIGAQAGNQETSWCWC
jgi:GTPase SAR1 family protein